MNGHHDGQNQNNDSFANGAFRCRTRYNSQVVSCRASGSSGCRLICTLLIQQGRGFGMPHRQVQRAKSVLPSHLTAFPLPQTQLRETSLLAQDPSLQLVNLVCPSRLLHRLHVLGSADRFNGVPATVISFGGLCARSTSHHSPLPDASRQIEPRLVRHAVPVHDEASVMHSLLVCLPIGLV